MKNKFANSKGITLVSLSITVVIIILISNMLLYNLMDNIRVGNLKNMQNDISNLREKISSYYAQNGEIPAKNQYTNLSNLTSIIGVLDTGDFYVIDLKALENLTLNYGRDYEKIQQGWSQTQINGLTDLYIINETTHNIFYVKGVRVDDEIFYTDYEEADKDTVDFNLINESSMMKWTPTYDKKGIYKDKNNDCVVVPKGFQVCNELGKNTVNEGLVIKNSQTNDTYIWIEVPKGVFQRATSKTDYENIKIDLENYTDFYKGKYDLYKDIWYAMDGSTLVTENTNNLTAGQKGLTNGCGLSYDQYVALRNSMYSSIYDNGGFWIAQYEAGIGNQRNSNSNTRPTPFSQTGKYTYNYITCSDAEMASQDVISDAESGDFKSNLMFGIQWDLVCKFIENKSDKIRYEINEDSSNWGNYGGTLRTTGSNEQYKLLNIYDFAGNVKEWTLEYTANTENASCTRGGCFNSGKGQKYCSSRSQENIDEKTQYTGFRVALY